MNILYFLVHAIDGLGGRRMIGRCAARQTADVLLLFAGWTRFCMFLLSFAIFSFFIFLQVKNTTKKANA